MRVGSVSFSRMGCSGALIGGALVASVTMGSAQSGGYGQITLVNRTGTTLVLNVRRLFPRTIIDSCQAPPNSTCKTGSIPAGLIDLEALSEDGLNRFARTYSLVDGENYGWTVSASPR
jgi:hypothetical protein